MARRCVPLMPNAALNIANDVVELLSRARLAWRITEYRGSTESQSSCLKLPKTPFKTAVKGQAVDVPEVRSESDHILLDALKSDTGIPDEEIAAPDLAQLDDEGNDWPGFAAPDAEALLALRELEDGEEDRELAMMLLTDGYDSITSLFDGGVVPPVMPESAPEVAELLRANPPEAVPVTLVTLRLPTTV